MSSSLPLRRVGACLAVLALTGCSQIDPNNPGDWTGPTTSSPSVADSASATPSAGASPVKASPSGPTPSPAVTAADGTVTCNYPTFGASVRPVKAPGTTGVPAKGIVTFTVTMAAGPISFTSNRAQTPCSTNSVVSLVKQSFYDGTPCHRLVDSGPYLLQCGDPSGTGRGGPGYISADELHGAPTYPAGTVALANTGQKDHNGSQFFIVYADSEIPASYTVIGSLDVASLAVVKQIAAQGQDGSDPNGGGKPTADTTITSMTVEGA